MAITLICAAGGLLLGHLHGSGALLRLQGAHPGDVHAAVRAVLDPAEGGQGAKPAVEGQPVPAGAHLPPALRGGVHVLVHHLPPLGAHLGSDAAVRVHCTVRAADAGLPSHDALLDLQEDGADDQPGGLEL